jgi:DNA-binding transcriptional LysR family regulator
MIDVPPDIVYQPIFTYEPVLIAPLDHPLAGKTSVTLEEIAPCGLILPPRHLSTWRIVDLVFHQYGLEYRVVLEAGGWEVIKKFVQLGLGLSIVTSICLSGDEPLAVIPLTEYFPTRSYGVVMRKGKFLSPQARAFIELMDPDFDENSAAAGNAANPLALAGRAGEDEEGGDFMGLDRSLP